MSAEVLISRLSKVKANGRGKWMALCPVHDDRSPSLSVKEEADGRVLVQCFAGCDTQHVINAVGLDWDDLMPEKIDDYKPPVRQRIYPSEALRIIQFEARLICLAAFDLAKGKELSSADLNRVKLAMDRINTAVETSNV